jgi:hypothetical protein
LFPQVSVGKQDEHRQPVAEDAENGADDGKPDIKEDLPSDF